MQGATITFIVPTRRGSELARRLREVVKRVSVPKGSSLKVVERPGKPILGEIAPNDPFSIQ